MTFWHVLEHYFGTLSGISSDILSGIHFCIAFAILSGISSDILALYLANLLTRG